VISDFFFIALAIVMNFLMNPAKVINVGLDYGRK
jgi:hypothetical protein